MAVDQSMLATLAKNAQGQDNKVPKDPIDEQDNNFNADYSQPTVV